MAIIVYLVPPYMKIKNCARQETSLMRDAYLELQFRLVGGREELDEPGDGPGGDERLDRRVPLPREDLPRRLHSRELHRRVQRRHSGLKYQFQG